jgi:hypothetical protein
MNKNRYEVDVLMLGDVDLLPLLDAHEQAQKQALIEELGAKAEHLEKLGFKADAVQIDLLAMGPTRELDEDAEIREACADQLAHVVIEFSPATLAHRDGLAESEALARREGQDAGLAVYKKAFELLAPSVVEGPEEWKGIVPVKLRPGVEAACYRAIQADLTMERRLFLTRLRSASGSAAS